MYRRLQAELCTRFAHDGVGWLLIQQIVIAPLSLLSTILLARILSISDYGYYRYALSMIAVFSVFGMTGIHSIAQLNIQRGRDEFLHLAFYYKKLLRFIPASLSLATALYYGFRHNEFLAIVFVLCSGYFIFVETYHFYPNTTNGKGQFRLLALFEVAHYSVSYFPPILVAYMTYGSQYVVAYVLLTTFVCQFTFRFLTFQYIKRRSGFEEVSLEQITSKDRTDFLRQSFDMSVNSGITSLLTNFSGVIVFNRLGAEQNAIYSFATSFVSFASTLVSAPLGKILFNLGGMTKRNESVAAKRRYVIRRMIEYLPLSTFLAILTCISIPFIYQYLLPRYIASTHLAMLYSLSIIFVAFQPVQYFFIERRTFKMISIVQAVVGGINLALLYILASTGGVLGAVWATLLSSLLNGAIWVILLYTTKHTYEYS